MYYVENTSAVLLQNYILGLSIIFRECFLCTFRPGQVQREFLVLETTVGIRHGTVCLQNVCAVFSFFSLKIDTN